jgi:hypothetical protein
VRRNLATALFAGLLVLACLAAVIRADDGSAPRPPAVAVPSKAVTRISTGARALHCRLRIRRFHTLPRLRPASACVALRRGTTPPEEGILVSPRPDPERHPDADFGLMLFSGDGKLLWYDRRPDKVHDLKQVTVGGRPELAFFQRRAGDPYYEFLDQSYRRVRRVRPGRGYPTDEHELQLTAHGTAYLASEIVRREILDYVVQEVDVATGKVRFQWRAVGNIGLRDSYDERPRRGAWDYFHGNSVDPPTAEDGTVIVSARNTSAIYGIDRRTGRTAWILGGKRDQFGLSKRPSWVFCTQHDVHRLPGGDLMIFDNGGAHTNGRPRCPLHAARVLVLRIDTARKRARLIRSIPSDGFGRRGRGILSKWVGSARPLANGDVLVDWGDVPRISVIGRDDRENLLLRLRHWSYRAVPARWVGRPAGAPAIAARGRDVWASWNGATEIRHWQVLGGSAPAELAPVGDPVAFTDLETHIRIGPQRYVAVRALDAAGNALGQSRTLEVR